MNRKVKILLQYKQRYLEAIIWITALVLLAFTSTESDHYSLCLLKNAGFEHCPGCGLGHSITYFFHGQFEASFRAHPLGIPAVIILSYRIFTIFKRNKKYKPQEI